MPFPCSMTLLKYFDTKTKYLNVSVESYDRFHSNIAADRNVIYNFIVYSFASLTRTLLSRISVNSDHDREKKWKNIPRLRQKKCLKI